MILTKKEHKEFLLEVLKRATIPGALVELAMEVKQEVLCAQIRPPVKVKLSKPNHRKG